MLVPDFLCKALKLGFAVSWLFASDTSPYPGCLFGKGELSIPVSDPISREENH